MEMETPGRQRPLGISILSVILIVFGVLALIAAILGIVGVAVLGGNHVALSAVAIVLLVVGAILALANIIVGWGLWTLKRWAFWTAVVVEVLNLVNGLYSLFVQHQTASILSLVVPIVILIYLFADRNVRAAFAV